MLAKLIVLGSALALASVVPANAACRPAGAALSPPSVLPCKSTSERTKVSVSPARHAEASKAVKKQSASSRQESDDDDPETSVPLAKGVDLDTRLGGSTVAAGRSTGLDDASNRRRSILPRSKVLAANGIRSAGPQALKKRTGDGVSLGLSFDLPQ